MHAESQKYIISLCSDPNVRSAEMWEEDGKTYIVISAYDGEDYGYEGRMSSWKVPESVRLAVLGLIDQFSLNQARA